MIISVPKSTSVDILKLREIFNDTKFHLPKEWYSTDFSKTLDNLYDYYIDILKKNNVNLEYLAEIRKICSSIVICIKEYHNGFPHIAYEKFSNIISALFKVPLGVYNESKSDKGFRFDKERLVLYRARNLSKSNLDITREIIFHVPFKMRHKVSTTRYSISGHPSLYLGTSLELSMQESGANFTDEGTVVSRFKINSIFNYADDIVIDVLELAIKPEDFLLKKKTDSEEGRLSHINLSIEELGGRYLFWYPIIAACSYVRRFKKDPFASEYIIPQLLMQWVHDKYKKNKSLLGIRYFSAATVHKSNLGYNYVFPTSNKMLSEEKQYCKKLAMSFELTKPIYTNKFKNIKECEEFLNNDKDLKLIY
ncbi:MAG: hypothetical protein AB1Z23_06730 [Eubacteriales bacterium]